MGKQFFTISAMGRIFCLPNAVWASASGRFRIVSDALVSESGPGCCLAQLLQCIP